MKLPQIHGRGLRITRTGHAILRRIAAGTYKFAPYKQKGRKRK